MSRPDLYRPREFHMLVVEHTRGSNVGKRGMYMPIGNGRHKSLAEQIEMCGNVIKPLYAIKVKLK